MTSTCAVLYLAVSKKKISYHVKAALVSKPVHIKILACACDASAQNSVCEHKCSPASTELRRGQWLMPPFLSHSLLSHLTHNYNNCSLYK